MRRDVTQCLVKIYQAVEKVYGPSGEMGIDLGLDKNGKLWFIECNSRSRKVSLRNAYNIQAIRRSSLQLLEYAKFITSTK
ncbi:YheC/YheD family protein [Caldalkalibacillus thermarum]|uniref:YheC/YheD family protein n=1 Tax=Caldalkalibacillus thermarum TaxID=296745 RepID=UPI003B4388DA